MTKRVVLEVEDLPSRAVGLTEEERKQILGGGLFKKRKNKNAVGARGAKSAPRVKKSTFAQK